MYTLTLHKIASTHTNARTHTHTDVKESTYAHTNVT